MLELILGGARSGKSRFAEKRIKTLAQQYSKKSSASAKSAVVYLTYIATAQAGDDEMAARIKKHQQDRNASNLNWKLVEQATDLAATLSKIAEHSAEKTELILVDCLTLWLTNCLLKETAQSESNKVDLSFYQKQKAALLETLNQLAQQKNVHLILVSNEVGHGIVPLGELSREFVDQSGWLHQEIAELANKVDFIVAGLAMNLKTSLPTPQEYMQELAQELAQDLTRKKNS